MNRRMRPGWPDIHFAKFAIVNPLGPHELCSRGASGKRLSKISGSVELCFSGKFGFLLCLYLIGVALQPIVRTLPKLTVLLWPVRRALRNLLMFCTRSRTDLKMAC